ncbi:MAG: hypothetical protein WBD40_24125 [Tepidisphaeraceae bacterium]
MLLVRFQRDRVRHDAEQHDRLLITSVGSFTLGDRDDGDVRVEGNRIVIGRSRYREQDTIIPLEGNE